MGGVEKTISFCLGCLDLVGVLRSSKRVILGGDEVGVLVGDEGGAIMEASCGELFVEDESFEVGFAKQQDRILIRADILEFDCGILDDGSIKVWVS